MDQIEKLRVLRDDADRALSALQNAARVKLISHDDGDGVFSAVILKRVTEKLGLETSVEFSTNEPDDLLGKVRGDFDLFVIADVGIAAEVVDREDVIIVDHHSVRRKPKRSIMVNTALYGLDGGSEISGSGVALALASTVLDWRGLAGDALAGAIGDFQNRFEEDGLHGAFIGVNREIWRLSGIRRFRTPSLPDIPLHMALATSTKPYIRDLALNPNASREFLRDIGIDPSSRPSELGDKERERLFSSLGRILKDQGASDLAVKWLETWDYLWKGGSLNTLATIVHHVARMGKFHAALRAAETGDFSGILRDYLDFQERLIEGIRGSCLLDVGSFYLVLTGPASRKGFVAEVFLYYLTGAEKAVGAVQDMGEEVGLSFRAPPGYGADLGSALKRAAEEAGGLGGGHREAAGANVPKRALFRFLDTLSRYLSDKRGKDQGPQAH